MQKGKFPSPANGKISRSSQRENFPLDAAIGKVSRASQWENFPLIVIPVDGDRESFKGERGAGNPA